MACSIVGRFSGPRSPVCQPFPSVYIHQSRMQKPTRFFLFLFLLLSSALASEDFRSIPLDLLFSSIKQHIYNRQNAAILTATRCRVSNLSGQRRSSFDALELARAFARIPSIILTIITTTNIDSNNATSRIIAKIEKAKA
jgi:ABC-type lipoprotein export system ATPase subunit